MEWKTNGVDFSIWVHPWVIYISVWRGGEGTGTATYVQISRILSPQCSSASRQPTTFPPSSSPSCASPSYLAALLRGSRRSVASTPPQQEKVMRFRAPYITRRMRNLIIKERHVAVRKICLFGVFLFSPPPPLLYHPEKQR